MLLARAADSLALPQRLPTIELFHATLHNIFDMINCAPCALELSLLPSGSHGGCLPVL